MIKISELLNLNNIKIINNCTYENTIDALLEMLNKSPQIKDYNKFVGAIKERETIVSTGIGLGLAMPHARKEFVKDFVCSAVLIKNGVEWKSIDDKPVYFAVLIGSSENTHREYLNLLSQIVLLWKNDEKRKQILKSTKPLEILEVFRKGL